MPFFIDGIYQDYYPTLLELDAGCLKGLKKMDICPLPSDKTGHFGILKFFIKLINKNS